MARPPQEWAERSGLCDAHTPPEAHSAPFLTEDSAEGMTQKEGREGKGELCK